MGNDRFHPWQLRTLIDRAMTKWPGCTFASPSIASRNLLVYDYDENYVGVITLGSRPSLSGDGFVYET